MSFINKLIDKFKLWIIPKIVYLLVALTNKSIRLKVIGDNNLYNINKNDPLLLAFWHGQMIIPIYYFRNKNYFTLASLSKDGEYITRVIKKFGWKVVRGSSSKGGSRSILKLYKKLLKGETTVLTPDGPQGPAYKVKPGIVYLQEKSKAEIIVLGVAIDKKIVANSWDNFNVPYPFTKAVIKISKTINLSKDKSIEERCQLLEEKMIEVQEQAEENLATWKREG